MTTQEEIELKEKELAALRQKAVNEAAAKGFNTLYTDSGQKVPDAKGAQANDGHKQELGGEGG